MRPTNTAQHLNWPVGFAKILAILMAISGVGYLSAVAPAASLAAVSATGVLALLGLGRRLHVLAFAALLGLLTGYAFLGKGFAYLGLPPLYVGEVILALLVLSFLVVPRSGIAGSHALLLAFMSWGLLCTIPYLTTYGLMALRDAVVWGYALFGLLVSLTLTAGHVRAVVRWFSHLLPWLLCWIPFSTMLYLFFGEALPRVPSTNVPIVVIKGGDIGVHSAALAVFVAGGLWAAASPHSRLPESVVWALWLGSFLIVASQNRGGFVAAFASVVVAFLLRPSPRWVRLTVYAIVFALALLVINPTIDVGRVRPISPRQVVANVTSIPTSEEEDPLQGTKEWRLEWWKKIVSYTFHGPYFLTGKGFGVNLANDDGFQVAADESLRSPHNGHMTILARMGVPGFLLWIGLQGAVGWGLVRGAMHARRRGFHLWSAVLVWLFAYWLAMLVNMSFDVYLEGPQGGIWFWTIVGLSIAAIRLEREATSDLDLSPQPQPVRHAHPAHP